MFSAYTTSTCSKATTKNQVVIYLQCNFINSIFTYTKKKFLRTCPPSAPVRTRYTPSSPMFLIILVNIKCQQHVRNLMIIILHCRTEIIWVILNIIINLYAKILNYQTLHVFDGHFIPVE